MEVDDRIVDGDESLEMSGGLKPLHNLLAPPGWQMRILRSIVEPLVLSVLEPHAHSRPSRAVGTELVGDHYPWRTLLLADEFAQELLRRAPIPAALNQSVENEAICFDGRQPDCSDATPTRHTSRDPFTGVNRR